MRLVSNRSLRARVFILLLLFLSLPRTSRSGTTITQTLHGPERFNYSSSTYTRTFSCPSTQGSFTLKVVNGDGDDDHFASSTLIKVNNTTIVGSGDLGSSTKQVSKSVTNLVAGNNTLSVKVNGHSGDYLTVTINGVYTLDVKITSPVSGAQLTADHTSVQGTYLAYTSNFSISVDNISASASSGNFNVSNVPLVSGSNLIRAVIATADGLTDQDNVSVNDNLPPIAEAGPGQTVRTGDNVALDGRGSSDPENAPIGYQWSFAAKPAGSQSTISGPNTVGPYFVPDLAGPYIAQLIVNDGVQNSPPDNVAVLALQPNTPPTAVAGAGQNVGTGSQVYLDGSGSFDPDNDPITYAWSMTGKPQQSQAVLSNPVAPAPTFVADESGAYLLELVVNDGQANSAPDNVTVVAVPPNVPPTAFAGPDALAPRNLLVHLDGSGSFDPEEQPLTYSWTLVSRPEGSSAILAGATTVAPSFVPDLVGDYVFRLIVNDGVFDSDPDVLIVTATNVPPVAVATAATNEAPVNTVISLDGSGSHDANNDSISFNWSLASAPAGSAASLTNSTSAVAMMTPDLAGNYAVTLIVNDGQSSSAPSTVAISAFIPPVSVPDVVGMSQASAQEAIATAGLAVGTVSTASSDTVPTGFVISQSPAAASLSPPGSSVNMSVSSGPLMVPVPVVLGMTQAETQAALAAVQLNLGSTSNAYSDSVAAGRVISQTPKSGTVILHGSSVSVVLSQGPEPVVIPPDPATIAPPPDRTVAVDIASRTRYLYAGANAIQTGVTVGAVEDRRVAVLRGKVSTRDGQPLSGVTVSIDDRPELGHTVSRSDGYYDLVVNGGGRSHVRYVKAGLLPVMRQLDTRWQEYARVPDVVMIPPDNQATSVEFTSNAPPVQVARGSVVTDAQGVRQSTLMVATGTAASLLFEDGNTRAMSGLTIRSTEYTVGASGPDAMPAPLPPTTGYTYCVELSADEANEAGAFGVHFDRPIYHYVENFLGFPVGAPVPVGFYDRKKKAWIPSDNGRIIRILDVSGGIAILDSTGSGSPDNVARYQALGVTEDERRQLATLYAPGTSLWRSPIPHFSTVDLNYPVGPPPGATGPTSPPSSPVGPVPPAGTGTEKCGSLIECQQQGLGEDLAIQGTPYSLTYRSRRTPGRMDGNTLFIPITGSTVPELLIRCELDIYVAGKLIHEIYDNSPGQYRIFEWDRRGFDNVPLHTPQKVLIRLAYIYPGYYAIPDEAERIFGLPPGIDLSRVPAGGRTIALEATWTRTIGNYDPAGLMLGGWSLDAHHVYDPANQAIHRGDGATLDSEAGADKIISTIVGRGNDYWIPWLSDEAPGTSGKIYTVAALASDEAGNVYFSEGYKVRRVDVDGIAGTIAGAFPTPGNTGDGGPANSATLTWVTSVATASDNSIYLLDSGDYRIRKIDPSGIISTVVGTGGRHYGMPPDAVVGTQFELTDVYGIAVGPDDVLHFVDQGIVWRLGADNVVRRIAGGGNRVEDGIPATTALLYPNGLAIGRLGTIYFFDGYQKTIRSVSPGDGLIRTIAGGAPNTYPGNGDGGAALSAFIAGLTGLVVDREKNDTLYFYDTWYGRIRVVRPDGTIALFAGDGLYGFAGDSGPAAGATFKSPNHLAVGPDGSVFIGDIYTHRVRKVAPRFPAFTEGEILIGSDDAREIYVFSSGGRHLKTLDALTGTPRLVFGYDPDWLLVSIADADNNVTIIERDASCAATGIVAPSMQRTVLGAMANDYLSYLTRPDGNSVYMTYDRGLLETYQDYRGYHHLFTYDELGRLKRDTDPAGGFLRLDRHYDYLDNGAILDIFTTTREYRTTHHEVVAGTMDNTLLVDRFPSGSSRTQAVEKSGGRTVSTSDGTTVSLRQMPDPRFGMHAPYTGKSTLRTPSGLISESETVKTAVFANPFDPLSLSSATNRTTVNGRIYATVFDNTTKSVTSTTPEGRQSISRVDTRGRLVESKADSSLRSVFIAYDDRGRIWKMAHESTFDNAWVYKYDAGNRLDNVTDPLMRTTKYGYDNADRVDTVRLPSGRVYVFENDPVGNRRLVVMPNRSSHAMEYTPVDLESSYFPPGSTEDYSHGYDYDKEWTRTTLPSGRTISSTFFDNTFKRHTITWPEVEVIYGYIDNDDRVVSITRNDLEKAQLSTYGYDGILKTRYMASGTATGEYRYAYDVNFFLTRIALDNAWNLLSRDNDGLLTGTGAFTIGRGGPAGSPDNVSDLTARDCGIGADGLPVVCATGNFVQEYSYDDLGRIAQRRTTVNGTTVSEETIKRDLLGRIETKTVSSGGGTTVVFEYGYDLDGQLDNVLRNGTLYEKYAYDLNGNRTGALALTIAQDNVQYDAQDRETGAALTFDADGFLSRRGTRKYSYSARGELLSVTDNTTGQTIATYAYDGTNRRVAKTAASGSTEQYLYGDLANPFRITATRHSLDNTLTTYFYDDFGALFAFERGGNRYYVGSDHLGTPKLVTDNAGNILRAMEYDSYGNRISDSAPNFYLPVGFAGGIDDPDAGMVRFGFRDYEPQSGRWAAKDPIFFEGGQANLYVYVGNEPINLVDRYGLRVPIFPSHNPAGEPFGGGAPYFLDQANNVSPVSGFDIVNRAVDAVKSWRNDRQGYDVGDLKGGFDLFLKMQKDAQQKLDQANGVGYCPSK
jgi:RHS repeat-associated protein